MRKSIVTVLEPSDPVYDLTTVDAVNAALGITGNTADDAIMAANITQASRIIGELCNRTFAMLTVSESFRVRWGEPVHVLNLRQFPVTELISITHADQIVIDQQLYELDYESGQLWMKCWRWAGEVVVEYTGGYSLPDDAPPLLSQATIETLRAQRALTSSAAVTLGGIRSTTHGDTTVTYMDPYSRSSTSTGMSSAALPPNAADMISRYKDLRV